MLPSISIQEPSSVLNLRQQDPSSSICLEGMVAASAVHSMSAWEAAEIKVCPTFFALKVLRRPLARVS